MYPELYQYLLQNKELPVPGIGTFLLERTSAVVDFPNKLANPPGYSFALKDCDNAPTRKFYCWLGSLLHVSDRDAVIRFNDFAFDMKNQLEAGDTIRWDGVGTIKKVLGGEIRLISQEFTPERPVTAEKVLREKAYHTVRVGEDEKTSEEMVQLLSQEEERRSLWWVWALAAALLAILFIGWYLSQHGLNSSSTANEKKLVPVESSPSYRQLP
jgi:hypothetical protein